MSAHLMDIADGLRYEDFVDIQCLVAPSMMPVVKKTLGDPSWYKCLGFNGVALKETQRFGDSVIIVLGEKSSSYRPVKDEYWCCRSSGAFARILEAGLDDEDSVRIRKAHDTIQMTLEKFLGAYVRLSDQPSCAVKDILKNGDDFFEVLLIKPQDSLVVLKKDSTQAHTTHSFRHIRDHYQKVRCRSAYEILIGDDDVFELPED